MVGKTGKSGRPKSAVRLMAFQVRLPADEAEALEKLVQKRDAVASQAGGKASASGVIRAILIPVLVAEGLLPVDQKKKG